MNAILLSTIFAAATLMPNQPRGILEGRLGEKFDAVLSARLFSENARGDIYAETTNAFATCYDDTRTDKFNYRDYSHKPGMGLWQGEYWGKMMLSAAKAIDSGASDEFKAWARQAALDFVKNYQRENGFIGTYRQEDFLGGPDGKGAETFCWNVWSRKYTIWALVELARTTDTPELLESASRVADNLIAQLKRLDRRLIDTGYFHGLPSVSILKPLLLLYRATGKQTYLEFCREVVKDLDRADGYRPNLIANAFSDKPIHEWYPKPGFWAKAYEMMSAYEGLIEYSRVTGEKRPLEAAKRAAEKIRREEANVLGGAGYHDHFVHAAARANAITEVCDVIHWMFLERELYFEDREVKRLDAIEYAMLNAFNAGIHREGVWGCHDVRSHGFRNCTAPFEVEMHYHFCCIANAPRGFAAYAEMLATAKDEDTAELNFYTDGKTAAAGVELAISGNYPVGREVKVWAKAKGKKRLAFRVPGWCKRMMVNGKVVSGPRHTVELEGEKSYTLVFDMPPVIHDRPAAAMQEDALSRDWFEMLSYCPESTFSAIETPRAYITRGPLLLAKSKRGGLCDGEIFTAETINGLGYTATLKPGEDRGTWGSWILRLQKGDKVKELSVTDYATATDEDDLRNAFSIWF